jgi:superfamily II DNA/RNA helicase
VSFFLSVSHAVPSPSNASSSSSFAELGVPPALDAVLARRGITAPRPIQASALPDVLAGHDVLGRAETGSGKTLAFGLPLLTRLATARAVPRSPKPRGLVLVPTRELAGQIRDELAPLAAAAGLKLLAVYGGAPIRAQVQALRRGTDVVVATPGRLTDLYRQGACSLDAVTITVLDEADHMADMGFLPQVTWLLDRVPAAGQRLLFSATLDNDVATIVRRYLADPVRRSVAPSSPAMARMDHQFHAVTAAEKVAAAAELAAGDRRVLLFVRTKHGATRLTRQLGKAGVQAAALHGNLAQNARQRALAAFSDGTVPVLVATDIAARGIHVDGVDLVVHFDPPAEAKGYLHRSGRTARAGAAGTVVTLVLPEQAAQVETLRRRAGLGETSPRMASNARERPAAAKRRHPRRRHTAPR